MKFSAIIGAAIVFFSATALAAYDMTYVTHAKAGETKELPVALPSGKSLVDVWAVDGSSISCVFIDRATGNVGYEAIKVPHCAANADLALPATTKAQITNNGNKEAELRIWVRSN